MNNDIITNVEFLNGLNINPIPLEFTQALTTTKWLLEMQAKLSSIAGAVNVWYDTLLTDLENNGVLYEKLTERIDSVFTQQLLVVNDLLVAIQAQLLIVGYVEPSIAITIAPTQTLYRVGETINGAVITFNVIKGSNNLVKAEVYKNGVLLSTINNVINGINTFTDGSIINSDSSYYIKLYDDKVNVISNTLGFQFVNNIYVGVVDNVAITNTLILSLTSIKMLKGEIDSIFSPNEQKILLAYPASYGFLSSIFGNGEELIQSFTSSVIVVSGVSYNVYVSNDVLYDTNHGLQFKF